MPQRSPDQLDQLGEISAPSGAVLVVDTGLLKFWSHDRPPLMPDWAADEATVALANSAIDLRVEGADAEAAGRVLGLNCHPRFLFDIPARGVAEVEARFDECVRRHGLDARLVVLDRRVPHRERVDLALAGGGDAGTFSFHGLWAVVVRAVPADRPLRVLGERMPEGPDAGRWRSVFLECRPGAEVVRSEPAGQAMVDEARLMFADVDALGAWRHNEALDGLADFEFWGRDAELVAQPTGAPDLGNGHWGWRDLRFEDAVHLALDVQRRRDGPGLQFATDFRPHSHHYRVLDQVRRTPTKSGTIEVGGAAMCTFMTSWGDGIFPVFRDLDATGDMLRIRIDLGCDGVVARQRELEAMGKGP